MSVRVGVGAASGGFLACSAWAADACGRICCSVVWYECGGILGSVREYGGLGSMSSGKSSVEPGFVSL